ncbi:MAG: hypothetical protein P1P84_17915, partial [Deferrisomatales bacterium]|nr:hypothetical protein [Deferrisomatales bacterium]
MKIEFRADSKKTELIDPKTPERKAIPSQVRHDPLTGRTARICHFMPLQWEKPDFDKLTAGTQSWCPFCPDKVLAVTPSFPPEILVDGRLVRDDMVLFPNLAPYDELGAVATLGSRHFTPMTEFTPEQIAKGFGLALEFFEKVHATGHPESVYHLINWNHMPPAGSSLIHSHLQVFASAHAPNLMRRELESARQYLTANASNFWDDYVALEERAGERFLGRTGNTAWLLAYAPMGVAGDVVGVVEGKRSTLELTAADLLDLGEGLCRAMRAYDGMGIWGFNVNLFTGAAVGEEHARVHIVFSPRTFFNAALGASDVGALRNLYNETICMAFP